MKHAQDDGFPPEEDPGKTAPGARGTAAREEGGEARTKECGDLRVFIGLAGSPGTAGHTTALWCHSRTALLRPFGRTARAPIAVGVSVWHLRLASPWACLPAPRAPACSL